MNPEEKYVFHMEQGEFGPAAGVQYLKQAGLQESVTFDLINEVESNPSLQSWLAAAGGPTKGKATLNHVLNSLERVATSEKEKQNREIKGLASISVDATETVRNTIALSTTKKQRVNEKKEKKGWDNTPGFKDKLNRLKKDAPVVNRTLPKKENETISKERG